MQRNPAHCDTDWTAAFNAALAKVRAFLLSQTNPQGTWTGELSSSALSTATAVVALDLFRRHSTDGSSSALARLADQGRTWLQQHANPDGGWGDTVVSKSNLSTTTLVWAALKNAALADSTSGDAPRESAIAAAERWLVQHAGGLDPALLAHKISERYGTDRTFSAPILTHCALAGRMGPGRAAWRRVIPLPFELAALPPAWFGALRLPVVSYALPALIAIGYARHYHAPSRNPLARAIRSAVTNRVLRVLERIQPTNGGFLEAIPLTSFVVMSLAGSGRADHPVAWRGIDFIRESVQPDGSWKIDTNLSTFVTSLAAGALCVGEAPPATIRSSIQSFLLNQQYRVVHPYTNAAPGGWAWTPLPGGVPDADDTSGALLALGKLKCSGPDVSAAVKLGIRWLLDLQNSDGGIPTFCCGWGKLPFDRSSADITAHALRAWAAWAPDLDPALAARVSRARRRAIDFLVRQQEPSGAWTPLWFGNESELDELNRVYGTSRVLLALLQEPEQWDACERALRWLVSVQKPDGGWSGGSGLGPSSVEETALALEALCHAIQQRPNSARELRAAVRRGLSYLVGRVADNSWLTPTPIGFYFAKLWYYERLYPCIFTLAAIESAARVMPSLLEQP